MSDRPEAVLEIHEIVNKKMRDRLFEFRFGRFGLIRPLPSMSVITERSIREFSKSVCDMQEKRVQVLLKEQKGKVTKVSFPVFTDDYEDGKLRSKRKQAFVPTSLLFTSVLNGKVEQFSPAWVLRNKLNEASEYAVTKNLNSALPWKLLLAGINENEVYEWAIERLAPKIEEERARREDVLKKYKEKMAAESVREASRKAAQTEFEISKAKAVVARKAKRIPELVLVNAHVQWVEWDSNLRKTEHEKSGCRVEFYGKKREITCPNGYVFNKMESKYLVITDEGELNETPNM